MYLTYLALLVLVYYFTSCAFLLQGGFAFETTCPEVLALHSSGGISPVAAVNSAQTGQAVKGA